MSNYDENTITAYISGKLTKQKADEIDKELLNNSKLLNTINDAIDAENAMKRENDINLPWQLKDFVKQKIDARFTPKLKIVIRLLKKGIEEIENNLSEGLTSCHAFDTRDGKTDISSFHYSHREKDAIYDIFAYFETSDTIRIRLEIKDSYDKSLPAVVKVFKSGQALTDAAASEGSFEMSSLERGEYSLNIEHKDILNPASDVKTVELVISLN